MIAGEVRLTLFDGKDRIVRRTKSMMAQSHVFE